MYMADICMPREFLTGRWWSLQQKLASELTNSTHSITQDFQNVNISRESSRRPNTEAKLFSDVEYAFQALAIDEQRLPFIPTLWHKTDDGPSKDLQQCWFPGVHGNIGGQAEDPRSRGDHEEIGDNAFAWMVSILLLIGSIVIL
jgi:hypothetical protein